MKVGGIMEEIINSRDLFAILRKRLGIIIAVTIGIAIISAIVSFYFMTPIYQTSTQLLVNQKKESGDNLQLNELQTNIQLANTYKGIIKSPVILDLVKEKLNLNVSSQVLHDKISVENEKNSQIISIKVQDKNLSLAKDIANTTADVFKNEISNIMKVDNVTILSKAEVLEGQSPISPKPLFNILVASIGGLVISVFISVLVEYFNNTFKKEQDVESILKSPVLGVVSHIEIEKNKNKIMLFKRIRRRNDDI